MTLTETLIFDPLRVMIMTYSHAKGQGQGQRPVGSKDRVDTNRETDGIIHTVVVHKDALTRTRVSQYQSQNVPAYYQLLRPVLTTNINN